MGEIGRMPKLWAVQAEGSSAIARAIEAGGFDKSGFEFRFLEHDRGFDSGERAAQRHLPSREAARSTAARQSSFDEEILEAQLLASSRADLFAEPSSACALAGFMKARFAWQIERGGDGDRIGIEGHQDRREGRGTRYIEGGYSRFDTESTELTEITEEEEMKLGKVILRGYIHPLFFSVLVRTLPMLN